MAFGGFKRLAGGSGGGLKTPASLDLSVIVTFHNCGSYLRECLESLEAQTLGESWEALLVDDGSTDGSADLAREFAARLPHFRVLSQAAQGVSAARNLGLSQARGRHVAFVNGTDAVEPDLYEHLLGIAKREGADLVLCDVARVKADGTLDNSNLHRLAFRNMPLTTTFADHAALVYDCTLFNKVISRDLAQAAELSFATGTGFPDLLPALRLYHCAKKICLYPGVGYRWRGGVAECFVEQRPADVTEFDDRVAALQSCYDFACRNGLDPSGFRMLDNKVLEHDLMLTVDRLDRMEPAEAHELMGRIRDLIEKWTLFDELPLRSALVRQKYAYVQADDLEGLAHLQEWQRANYQSARVTVGRTRGYRVAIPKELLTVERPGITQDIRRWPPMCKLVEVEQQGSDVLLHGFVYKRRTCVLEGSQRVSAFLVNARTGKELKLMIQPEVSKNAVRLYGRILEAQTGKKRRYETEGAGFCLSLPVSALAADPDMQGLNFIRIHYANRAERGTVYMRRIREASRQQIAGTVFRAGDAELRIDLGPVDQARILVGPAGSADPA
ncbi:MAG: glycosyltransferase [Coriobacteriia bacterium]|nr:glycosyltransferase [Coriobacteriia bacterium]